MCNIKRQVFDLLGERPGVKEWSVKEIPLYIDAYYIEREGLNEKYFLMGYAPKNPQGLDIGEGMDIMKAMEPELWPLHNETVARWFLGLGQILCNRICGFNYFAIKEQWGPLFEWVENAIQDGYLRIIDCCDCTGEKKRIVIFPTEKMLLQQQVPLRKK